MPLHANTPTFTTKSHVFLMCLNRNNESPPPPPVVTHSICQLSKNQAKLLGI